jgi:hypothetical protein
MSSCVSTQIAQKKLAELESAKASLCVRLKTIETEALEIRKKLAEIDAKKEAYTDMIETIEKSEETRETSESERGQFLKCVYTGEFLSLGDYSRSERKGHATLSLSRSPQSRFTEIHGEISRKEFVAFEFFSRELSKAFLLDNAKESRSQHEIRVLLYHRIHEKPYPHQRWAKCPVRGGFQIKCTKDDNILVAEDGTVHTIPESIMTEEQKKRSVWTYVD